MDYKTIWLEPWCLDCERSRDDLTWCEDDVWGKCAQCGQPPIKYVLADDQPKIE